MARDTTSREAKSWEKVERVRQIPTRPHTNTDTRQPTCTNEHLQAGGVTLHEAFTLGVLEVATLATRALCDQAARACGVCAWYIRCVGVLSKMCELP